MKRQKTPPQSASISEQLPAALFQAALPRAFPAPGWARLIASTELGLAAVELALTQDELRQLDEVSALAHEYPGWALPFQGADRLEPVDRWVRFSESINPD